MMFGRKKYERSHYSRGVMAAEGEYKIGLYILCDIKGIEEKDLTADQRLDMLEQIQSYSTFDYLSTGEDYAKGVIEYIDHEKNLIEEGLK